MKTKKRTNVNTTRGTRRQATKRVEKDAGAAEFGSPSFIGLMLLSIHHLRTPFHDHNPITIIIDTLSVIQTGCDDVDNDGSESEQIFGLGVDRECDEDNSRLTTTQHHHPSESRLPQQTCCDGGTDRHKIDNEKKH